jgi:hypothetical protein
MGMDQEVFYTSAYVSPTQTMLLVNCIEESSSGSGGMHRVEPYQA